MTFCPLFMVGLKNQRLLVIAPHPDDEVLGCGGLIKKIKDNKGKVYVLFMTVGNTQDFSKKGSSTFRQRVSEIEKVAKFLKYDDYTIAFPGDTFHLKLDKLSQLELISALEKGPMSISQLNPSIIALPQPPDYNQDHRASALATIAALRPAPGEFKPVVPLILGYEFAPTAAWGVAPLNSPNFFVSLSESDLKTKVKAMEFYASQKRNGSHSRSAKTIKSLAYLRGSQCGQSAAEAYYNFRTVV